MSLEQGVFRYTSMRRFDESGALQQALDVDTSGRGVSAHTRRTSVVVLTRDSRTSAIMPTPDVMTD